MPAAPTLIIDTDFFADVDDVGALALAHGFASLGLCELGVVALDTPSVWGAPAVRAINGFFGRDVPVGAFWQHDESIANPGYAHLLAGGSRSDVEGAESVDLILATMEQAEDGSVILVSIGFLDNLADVALRAPELVSVKVRDTVVMAGQFPEGREFNIHESPEAARVFIHAWPSPITFLGWEVGADVITGKFPGMSRGNNPVIEAYDLYSGIGNGRMSWDLQAVDLAVRGDRAPYRLSAPGEMLIAPDGSNTWQELASGRHRYAIPTATPAAIAAELDSFLARSFEVVGA